MVQGRDGGRPRHRRGFGPPPPGIDLNTRQDTAFITVAILSAAFATTALALRIWARNFQRFGMMADNYLMIISLVFTYGTLVITILGAKAGAGRHVWALHPPEIAHIFKLLYSYTFIYAGSVSFCKLSILLFYRRLFERGSVWFKVRLAFAAFFTIGYLLSIWGAAAALCRPVRFFWTQFLGETGKCLDINATFLSLTVLNLVADLLVLVVPIPEILALQMSRKKKVGVMAVMALGGLVCVVSAVRIWAFYESTVQTDIVWVQADVFLLSSVGPAFGIISACLPSLRPLYRRAHAKITGKDTDPSSISGYAKSKGSRGMVGGSSYVRFGDEHSKRSGNHHHHHHHLDDLALTNIGKGPTVSTQPISQNTILVQSEITQFTDDSSRHTARHQSSVDTF
ncbi:hypothetical protein F5Y17DRAFT_472704 [Xylariaceae sp. FL0594]|nr:hypothetical protein F5Y17DRAFT_472704 [Xylariaceae sp. FL0594]